MEAAMCDLSSFKDKNTIDDEMFWSITYQLFISLCVLHFKYGIVHGDVKPMNVLVLPVTPGGYFRYVMDDKEYFVKNHGYLFCLHDFGLSKDYKSNTENVPIRNARVLDDGTLETLDNTFNYKPNFSKSDIKQFPIMNFFYDIQNLITSLVGVKKTIKEASYNFETKLYELFALPGISKKIIAKLRKLQTEDSSVPYDTQSSIYLRADMVLDYLYRKPDNIDYISDNFII
jgi:serine/threonine protein kinase